jgi:hypothetical protein
MGVTGGTSEAAAGESALPAGVPGGWPAAIVDSVITRINAAIPGMNLRIAHSLRITPFDIHQSPQMGGVSVVRVE